MALFTPPMQVFVFLFVQQTRVLDTPLVRFTARDSSNNPEMVGVRDSSMRIIAAKGAATSQVQVSCKVWEQVSFCSSELQYCLIIHYITKWITIFFFSFASKQWTDEIAAYWFLELKKKMNEKKKKKGPIAFWIFLGLRVGETYSSQI